ncbi:MAG TPA: adenylyl-sulfate kinase [Bacteroidia bacterium]|jgi:adenylylsulfate kinase|nr:adenylyl-sulfate kinase [Bacteroidia bacterium]
MEKNVIPHSHTVTKKIRQLTYNHKSLVIWFTGLSGSGKSTLAGKLEEFLFKDGIKTYVLDGDNIRTGLNKDLNFSHEDRVENIRRIGEVSKLFIDAGVVVLTAFISPYEADRAIVRNLLGESEFIEVFVKCPVETCEQRDVKGLYKKARAGEIKNFTGINSPYEEPKNAEVVIETNKLSLDECVEKISQYILPRLKP